MLGIDLMTGKTVLFDRKDVETELMPTFVPYVGATTNVDLNTKTLFNVSKLAIGLSATSSYSLDVNGKIAINGEQTIYNAGALNGNFVGTLYLGNGGGSLTSGAYYNMAMGKEALYSNTSGNTNVAIGVGAMYTNTTGEQNFGMGFHALYGNTSGQQNLGIGTYALVANTTGNYNVALGNVALFYNTIGSGNVSIGYDSGSFNKDWGTLTTNNYSVFIGYDSKAYANGDTNEVVIGYNADGKGSNTVVIGNSSITDTYLGGYINPVIGYKSTDGSIGATGSFTTADSKTVTVKNGLITNIA